MQLEKKLQDAQQKTQEQQKQIDDLNTQLQAKKASQSLLARAVNFVAPVAYADAGTAKMFIYMHESGNSPGSVNSSSGACGLGQALPCSKLPCSLSDYVCQDNWFTNNYMIPRYGSWENAKAFWLAHNWW